MSDDPNLRLYRKPQVGADLVLGAGAPTPNDSPDLLFHVPQKTDANLEFAGEVATPPSVTSGILAAQSAPSSVSITAYVSVTGSLTHSNAPTMADIAATLSLAGHVAVINSQTVVNLPTKFDINVPRGPANNSVSKWHRLGAMRMPQMLTVIPKPQRHRREPCASWGGTVVRLGKYTGPLRQLTKFSYQHQPSWQEALALGSQSAQSIIALPRFWYQEHSQWQEAKSLPTFAESGFFYPPKRHKAVCQTNKPLKTLFDRVKLSYRLGNETTFIVCGNWHQGTYPAPGISVIPVPEPDRPDPEGSIPATSANLNFWQLRLNNGNLEFARLAKHEIPARKCYVITNTAFIVRSRDGADIPATEVGIEIDVDSWAWQFSATIPKLAALALAKNEQLTLHINGHEWHGTVDSWQSSRAWNSQSATISGRSLSAELSPTHVLPGSVFEPAERSIIQLAEQALPANWLLDWQAPDWLIPAGVFTAHNQTPIEIIKTLAESAGAYVLPHATKRKLSVLPRYPTAPWQWAVQFMDVQVPPNIIVTAGSEHIPGNAANGVYVSGGEQGVTIFVKRTGTAGAALLPMVTNPLITDVNAGTAVGIVELAKQQPHDLDTIEMPISSETGLILPGTMLIADGMRGIARSLRVDASNQGNGLVVRQQLTVERHQ
ncbi:MAG: hypothetical protein WBH20_03270 [Oceanisphaera sp.]|uniref:hypothetical protein n=1 Tax=Oceanisphaera sp. TaxID=1929979 RepID=UPI003C77A2BD